MVASTNMSTSTAASTFGAVFSISDTDFNTCVTASTFVTDSSTSRRVGGPGGWGHFAIDNKHASVAACAPFTSRPHSVVSVPRFDVPSRQWTQHPHHLCRLRTSPLRRRQTLRRHLHRLQTKNWARCWSPRRRPRRVGPRKGNSRRASTTY
jgi:hypothetical protein